LHSQGTILVWPLPSAPWLVEEGPRARFISEIERCQKALLKNRCSIHRGVCAARDGRFIGGHGRPPKNGSIGDRVMAHSLPTAYSSLNPECVSCCQRSASSRGSVGRFRSGRR
jgi:hypothetical protein